MKSQFRYYPFARMFCSRRAKNLINCVHERTLKYEIYDDNIVHLLNLYASKMILLFLEQIIQTLVKDVYKFMNFM